MSDEPMLTIKLSKSGNTFRADLEAPSEVNGVTSLRVHGTNENAIEAIQTCLTELESKAADGDEIALRFTGE
jgi:hypothetical protein